MRNPDEPINYVRLDDLILMADALVGPGCIADMGLLDSAAARPRSSVFGQDAYPLFEHKLAALMHSIAKNHALVDGNKRLAWMAARVMCQLNDRDLRFSVDEAEAMVQGVADGSLDTAELAVLLGEHLSLL